MSAINSNSDDRDLEAVRRAQRAHEPSMEEILASIRNIIADEREPTKQNVVKPSSPRSVSAAAGPQIVYSNDALASQRALPEPIHRVDVIPVPDSNAPKVVWRQPDPAGPAPVIDAADRNDEPLLSREADEAVAASFEALSANLAIRSAEIAEGVAREMLRPMLKQWLDENLPGIVERLVRAEIERVARGPK
jgi:cell pole-organizing protein PopZ